MGEVNKPEFNQNSNYEWQADDTFSIDGKTFDIMYKFFQTQANTPETQKALISFEIYNRLHNLFVQEVESGKIKEVIAEKDPV